MNSEKEGQRFTYLNLSTAIRMSYYLSNLIIENMRDDNKGRMEMGIAQELFVCFFQFSDIVFSTTLPSVTSVSLDTL